MTARPDISSEETSPVNERTRSLPIVAGNYEVDLRHPIGAGGMAVVYLGRDLRSKSVVALKTLRLEYRNDPASRARFRREIRTMAFLVHHGVPEVYDLWEDDASSWAVLEYIQGISLKELIRSQNGLDLYLISDLLDQIAETIGYLHAQKLVHLDIKPQNVIVEENGATKLIDFGLTQLAARPAETVGGQTFGTAAYIAPEQASGGVVDGSTDIYSLGCMVYEMVTGQTPFAMIEADGAPSDLIDAHIELMPVPPSVIRPDLGIPAAVDDVVMWALFKRPSQRYHSAQDFAELFRLAVDGATRSDVALSRPLEQTMIDAVPVSRKQTRGRPGQWHRAISWLWKLCLLFLLLNLAIFAYSRFSGHDLPGLSVSGAIGDGTEVTVMTEGLNLRTEPGLSSATIRALPQSTTLTVTGPGEVVDGETWWPVQVAGEGTIDQGYVWAGGIEADSVTPIEWIKQQFD